MKKLSAVVAIGIILLVFNKSHSQDEIKKNVIDPYPLGITYFKTSNLVFPYAIVSVDRGSKDVLVQQATGVDNILHVKAGKADFEETNLTIVTADGHLYSYVLHYTDRPTQLNLQYISRKSKRPEAIFSPGFTNEAEMRADAAFVISKKRTLRTRDKKYGIQVRLESLYIREDVLYFTITLRNDTNINYDIDQFRFFISDQKKSKRTASQELEITPLYIYQETSTVIGQEEHKLVYALPKFTIPDKKQLIIQVMEKDGGRHLELKVPNRIVVQAKAIKGER